MKVTYIIKIAGTVCVLLFTLFSLLNLYHNADRNDSFENNLHSGKAVTDLLHQIRTSNPDTLNIIAGRVGNLYPNISNVFITEGRYFLFNTDQTLTGERITKEIFDTQREFEQIQSEESEKANILYKWLPEQKTLYYPIIIENDITGIAGLQLNEFTTAESRFNYKVVYIAFLIAFLLLSVTAVFLKKISLLIAPVIYSLLVFLIIYLFSLQLQFNQETWQKLEEMRLSKLSAQLSELGQISPVALPQSERQPVSVSSWVLIFVFIGSTFLLLIFSNLLERFFRMIYKYRIAYAYTIPAMFGVFLLVFFPLVYGILIGFTSYSLGDMNKDLIEYFSDVKVYGFSNFFNILKEFNLRDYQNFYFTLFHTVLWTIINVTLHVSIGIGLALLLNDTKLRGKTFFRIIYILPWAVPTYITALIWKGLFHRQFGAINGLISALGGEPISWFSEPLTAFLANLTTNIWLGFPFMMIIALGALQSIPKELYEAASIDGSSRWQSFWTVTLPLLKPAMVPAVILGTIWTFNQFNVIYLVSGGGPKGATELLITDAYKLAFEQYRYGYAAAYCIIIFALLIVYGQITAKITKATSGVYE